MSKNSLDAFKFDQTEEVVDTSKKVKIGIIGTGWIAGAHLSSHAQDHHLLMRVAASFSDLSLPSVYGGGLQTNTQSHRNIPVTGDNVKGHKRKTCANSAGEEGYMG